MAVQRAGRAESWPCRELAVQTRGRAGTSPEGHDHAASGCSCTTSQLRTPANRPLTHIRSRTDRTRHGAPARHATTCQHHAPASCDGRARASYTCTHAPTMYDAAAVPVAPQPDSTTFRPRTTVEPVPRTRMLTRRPVMTRRRRPSSHSTTFLPRLPHSSQRLVHARACVDHVRRCRRARRATTRLHHAPASYACAHASTTYSGRARRPTARRSYLAPHPSQRLVHARARVDHVRRRGRALRAQPGSITCRPRDGRAGASYTHAHAPTRYGAAAVAVVSSMAG